MLTLTGESTEGGVLWTLLRERALDDGSGRLPRAERAGSNDNSPYPDTDVEGGPTVPVRSAREIQRQRHEQTARRTANFHWLEPRLVRGNQ